jgi:hypothetical protein
MTPITRQDILAHQAVVPWSTQHQVEQDLLLCRAMVALFDDAFLSSQIAMRGGTLLHKSKSSVLGNWYALIFVPSHSQARAQVEQEIQIS